jgi:hypothetical protein
LKKISGMFFAGQINRYFRIWRSCSTGVDCRN